MRPLAFCIALCFAGQALAAYPVPSRITVDADEVTLADLTPGAPEAWSEVALGRAPRPGGERTLDREWVLQRARQVGADEELDLGGDVVLERPGQKVGRKELVGVVTGALGGQLGPGEELRVTAVGLPGTVPTGPLDLRPRVPEGSLSSPSTVWVDVYCRGRRAARAWVRLEVRRGGPALVLTRTVSRGEVLERGDVELQTVPAGAGGLGDPAEVLGKRLVRTLSAGAVLSGRDVASVPAVERGDPVRLVARVGGVKASAIGKCLGSGAVGDSVEVENVTSGRTLTGVVLGGGVVDVTARSGR